MPARGIESVNFQVNVSIAFEIGRNLVPARSVLIQAMTLKREI